MSAGEQGVPERDESNAIVLYDGVCKFCNKFIRFIIDRDPDAHFRFAALESEIGMQMRAEHGIDSESVDSVVLIRGGQAYLKSAAALRILASLGALWPLMGVFRIFPRLLNDWFYDAFAKRRYRWFGKSDACPMPTPELKSRYID